MASKSKKKKVYTKKIKEAKSKLFTGKIKTVKKTSKTSKKKKAKVIPGKIGNFGTKITFVVTNDKIMTFSGFNKTVSARWATHPSINKKEKTEFIGSGLTTINMTIALDAAFGINPKQVINDMEDLLNRGTSEYLIIGGKKVGSNRYRITSMSENWDTIMPNGVLYQATVDVTFEEYA